MKKKPKPGHRKTKTKNRRSTAHRTGKPKRPDWDTYFLKLAELASERATCLRRKVGAVIVKDTHLLSTGYNGAPKGVSHCSVTGCLREKLKVPSGQRHELCRGLHAEQNAIIQAAVYGASLNNAKLYCTNLPCSICAKMIVNAGIKEVITSERYPDRMTDALFREAKVKLSHIKKRRKQ